MVETFFKTIKSELIWPVSWQTRSQAENAVARYIDGFYNPIRRHSTLGYQSPVHFKMAGREGAISSPLNRSKTNTIAAKHKVHPNQVSTWKRQAMDGLGAVFSNGADKARVDHEGEVHNLHAKIGQLTVERDFLARGLKR